MMSIAWYEIIGHHHLLINFHLNFFSVKYLLLKNVGSCKAMRKHVAYPHVLVPYWYIPQLSNLLIPVLCPHKSSEIINGSIFGNLCRAHSDVPWAARIDCPLATGEFSNKINVFQASGCNVQLHNQFRFLENSWGWLMCLSSGGTYLRTYKPETGMKGRDK